MKPTIGLPVILWRPQHPDGETAAAVVVRVVDLDAGVVDVAATVVGHDTGRLEPATLQRAQFVRRPSTPEEWNAAGSAAAWPQGDEAAAAGNPWRPTDPEANAFADLLAGLVSVPASMPEASLEQQAAAVANILRAAPADLQHDAQAFAALLNAALPQLV